MLAVMVGILVLFWILKDPCLKFFLLSVLPYNAVGYWYIDSMALVSFS